jgi:hypothetical protein
VATETNGDGCHTDCPQSFVLLTIDPESGEIEAYGPLDSPGAVAAVAGFEASRVSRSDGLEQGVLVLPLWPLDDAASVPGEARSG